MYASLIGGAPSIVEVRGRVCEGPLFSPVTGSRMCGPEHLGREGAGMIP